MDELGDELQSMLRCGKHFVMVLPRDGVNDFGPLCDLMLDLWVPCVEVTWPIAAESWECFYNPRDKAHLTANALLDWIPIHVREISKSLPVERGKILVLIDSSWTGKYRPVNKLNIFLEKLATVGSTINVLLASLGETWCENNNIAFRQ